MSEDFISTITNKKIKLQMTNQSQKLKKYILKFKLQLLGAKLD